VTEPVLSIVGGGLIAAIVTIAFKGSRFAVPNYGLFRESSIPDDKQMRHMMISWLPLVVYVATEIALRLLSAM
jgi:hypothetical protein